MASGYKSLSIPLGGGPVEITDDSEVFIKSPHAARQERQKTKKSRAIRSMQKSRLAAIGKSGCESAPTSPNGFALNSREDKSLAEARRFDETGRSDDSDDKDTTEEEDVLEDGIKRRAAEQMMFQNLKLLATKMRQYPSHRPVRVSQSAQSSPRHSSPLAAIGNRREEAREHAMDFQVMYSDTVGILQKHMTVNPPRRRHTVTYADLAAYSSPSSTSPSSIQSSLSPMKDRQKRVLNSRRASRISAQSMRSALESIGSSQSSRTGSCSVSADALQMGRASFCLDRTVSLASVPVVVDDPFNNVCAAFNNCLEIDDGKVDICTVAELLRCLDPDYWTELHVSCLLAQMNVDSEGRVNIEEWLAWIFDVDAVA